MNSGFHFAVHHLGADDKWCTTTKHDIISQFYVQFSDLVCLYVCECVRDVISKRDDKEFVNIFYLHVQLRKEKNEIHMKIDGWHAKKTPVNYLLFYTDIACSHSITLRFFASQHRWI